MVTMANFESSRDTHGRGLPRFDHLLRCFHRGLARRRSRIAWLYPPCCADISTLDRYCAWHPPIRLGKMGCAPVFRFLAPDHDRNLALPPRLCSHYLPNLLFDRNLEI